MSKHHGTAKLADSSHKRERSPSVESRGLKKTRSIDPKSSIPKQVKSTFDHVRTWLTEASEKELDTLAGYLTKRKKKRSGRVNKPEAEGDLESNVVVRKITTTGLNWVEAELFLEHPRSEPKRSHSHRAKSRR